MFPKPGDSSATSRCPFWLAVVALLDLKTDRAAGRLLVQAWHWLDDGRPRAHKKLIEEELSRFERFQLGD